MAKLPLRLLRNTTIPKGAVDSFENDNITNQIPRLPIDFSCHNNTSIQNKMSIIVLCLDTVQLLLYNDYTQFLFYDMTRANVCEKRTK